MLEDLIVVADRGPSYPDIWREAGPVTVFKNSPLLRRVVLGFVSSDDYFPTMILPWQQLTHLILLSPTPAEFYTAYMGECPLLRFAALLPIYTEDLDLPRLGGCCWPTVSNITLSFWDTGYPATFVFPLFFRYLSLGRLESLRLLGPHFDLRETDVALFRESLRAMTSLQYLSLCLASIDATRYIDILQQLPQLSTLDSQLRKLYKHDDDPLHIFNTHPNVLPNLLILILDIGPGWASPFSAENLESFVETRALSPLGKRLREVIVYVPHDLKGPEKGGLTIEKLRTIQSRNLEVAITIKNVAAERCNLEGFCHWVDRDP